LGNPIQVGIQFLIPQKAQITGHPLKGQLPKDHLLIRREDVIDFGISDYLWWRTILSANYSGEGGRKNNKQR
jgi:hypothetical protein